MSKLVKIVFVSGDTLRKELGEFHPDQVSHVVALAKEHGVSLGNDEYDVGWTGFEIETGCFEIVVTQKIGDLLADFKL